MVENSLPSPDRPNRAARKFDAVVPWPDRADLWHDAPNFNSIGATQCSMLDEQDGWVLTPQFLVDYHGDGKRRIRKSGSSPAWNWANSKRPTHKDTSAQASPAAVDLNHQQPGHGRRLTRHQRLISSLEELLDGSEFLGDLEHDERGRAPYSPSYMRRVG